MELVAYNKRFGLKINLSICLLIIMFIDISCKPYRLFDSNKKNTNDSVVTECTLLDPEELDKDYKMRNDTIHVYSTVDKMPEFIGGADSMFIFINKNLDKPKDILTNNCKDNRCRVILQFIVCKDGTIDSIKVLRGLYLDLDSAAIRVVKKMPKWKPGIHNGKKVNVRFAIPVEFKKSMDEDKN